MEERLLQPRRERSTARIVLSCLSLSYAGAWLGFFVGMMLGENLLLYGLYGVIVGFGAGVWLRHWLHTGRNQPIESPPPARRKKRWLPTFLATLYLGGLGALVGFVAAYSYIIFLSALTAGASPGDPEEMESALRFFLGFAWIFGLGPGALGGVWLGLWVMNGGRGEAAAPRAPYPAA